MSKKSGRGNPPKEFQFKTGVSGNLKGRPPKSRKDQLVIDIISEFRNILTAYREGGRPKRASRLELLLKKLVNSALEGMQGAPRYCSSFAPRPATTAAPSPANLS
jgi:hypothetical protein